jgi:hypothetical protein
MTSESESGRMIWTAGTTVSVIGAFHAATSAGHAQLSGIRSPMK